MKIPGATARPVRARARRRGAPRRSSAPPSRRSRRASGKTVEIPTEKATGLAGFSVEAIVGVLSKVDPADPLKPVIDNIVAGNIYGAVAFAGCSSPKIRTSEMTEIMAKDLLAKNVLVVTTGCTAHILRAGRPDERQTPPRSTPATASRRC